MTNFTLEGEECTCGTLKYGDHTNSWDGGDDLSQFELVENSGLPSCVQAHHKNAHLLLADQALQQIAKNVPHGGRFNSAGLCSFSVQ